MENDADIFEKYGKPAYRFDALNTVSAKRMLTQEESKEYSIIYDSIQKNHPQDVMIARLKNAGFTY